MLINLKLINEKHVYHKMYPQLFRAFSIGVRVHNIS